MKKMTYAKLQQKINDGNIEINAWAMSPEPGTKDYCADVFIYPNDINKPPKREQIIITKIPTDADF